MRLGGDVLMGARQMYPGDVDRICELKIMNDFPEGTILEAVIENAACLAYKVSAFQWTITGLDGIYTDALMAIFEKHWRVIRWGPPL
jgi:hypothetical protein